MKLPYSNKSESINQSIVSWPEFKPQMDFEKGLPSIQYFFERRKPFEMFEFYAEWNPTDHLIT